MTVKELIDMLQMYEPETPVHIAYNSGDYWRTVVAPVATNVEELPTRHSDYHNKPVLIDEDDKDYDSAKQVVVIS
jgi:hypothetical protein